MSEAVKYKPVQLYQCGRWTPQWSVACSPNPLYISYQHGSVSVYEELDGEMMRLREIAHTGPLNTFEMQELTKDLIDWTGIDATSISLIE